LALTVATPGSRAMRKHATSHLSVMDMRSTMLVFGLVLLACSSADVSSSSVTEKLSGCHGQASSAEPSDGNYFLTSFGNSPSDNGQMSCGEDTQDGSWYYAASRQRYGCGAHIQIEANGNCVVAETDDYGPDECVETAAGGPIIDASPLVAEALFGVSGAGWSDHLAIHVTQVDSSTPLGACGGAPTPPQPAQCNSATLGMPVPEGTCVQSASDGNWYQCTSSGWESGGDTGSGPDGPCSATYPLG
jgi:hypothetical protein